MSSSDEELGVDANDYGEGEYGAGAYGADYDPTTTDHHDFPYLEQGESDYDTSIDDTVDRIDELAVLVVGPEESRPADVDTNLFVINILEIDPPDDAHDYNVPALIEYEVWRNGDWETVRVEANINEELLFYEADDQTVSGLWEWTEDAVFDGNITGRATDTEHAFSAESCRNASMLENVPGENFALRREDQTVEGRWIFRRRQVFEERLEIRGGTLTLPRYG